MGRFYCARPHAGRHLPCFHFQPHRVAFQCPGTVCATFAIQDFKMFERGSALPACTGDIIPGPPVQALCSRLDASPSHACSFTSLPTAGHLTCHANHHDQCRTWFEDILPP